MFKIENADFNELIQQSGRTMRARMVFDTFTFEEEIKSYNLNAGDDELTVGKAYMTDLDVIVFGTHENLRNKRFTFELGLLINNEFVFVPVGKFVVKIAALKSDVTEISCADYMYLLERRYTPKIQFPATIDQVTKEILDFVGLPYEGNFETERSFLYTPINYNMREIIAICSSIQGKNAYFDRYGNLVYKWFEDSNLIINDEQIQDPTIYDSDFIIEYFEVDVDGEVYFYGDDESEMGIFINSSFFIDVYANMVYDQLKGFTYRPAEIPFIIANPLLDPWDIVTYKNWKIPCMKLEYSFDGGLWGDLTTYVLDTTKDYATPFEREQAREEQTTKDNNLILDDFNKENINFGTAKDVLTIEFTTKESNLPVFEFTGQFEALQDSLIMIDLFLDGVLLQTYKNTVQTGFRVISLIIPLKNLHQGGHNLNVKVYTNTGNEEAVILAGQAKGVIWGDGLLGVAKWNGIIDITQPISIISNRAKMLFNDNVITEQRIPTKINLSEAFTIISKRSTINLIDTLTTTLEESV